MSELTTTKPNTPFAENAGCSACLLAEWLMREMSPTAYLFCIARAEESKTLHGLTEEISVNPYLNDTERVDLFNAIRRRFSFLNSEFINQKPRWN